MRILIAARSIYPNIGGVESSIDYISSGLSKMGHNVTIITSLLSSDQKREETINGIMIIRIPFQNKGIKEIGYLKTIFLPRYLQKTYRKFLNRFNRDFDLIISRDTVFTVLLSKKYGVDKVVYIPAVVYKNYRWRIRFFSLRKCISDIIMNCQLTLDWRFQKKCFKNNIVVVFSRNMKNQIEELVNTKYFVKVIYPGTKYVVNYKKKERNQKCSLVYVGRLGVEKNVDFLIESYALCRNKNESVLTIVGDGGEMDNLKGLVSKLHLDNHVYFAGKQYDLEKYYSNSDYLIMPTIYEAFGFVIIEAQTFGIPVIGFKNNGKNIRTAVDEVVSNGDNGFVCNNYSKYDFATVMDKAIETYFTDNYSGMVEKSFVNAKNNYDWMLFLERLICFSSEKRE